MLPLERLLEWTEATMWLFSVKIQLLGLRVGHSWLTASPRLPSIDKRMFPTVKSGRGTRRDTVHQAGKTYSSVSQLSANVFHWLSRRVHKNSVKFPDLLISAWQFVYVLKFFNFPVVPCSSFLPRKAHAKKLACLLLVRQSDKQTHWHLKNQVCKWFFFFSQEVICIGTLEK